MVEVTVKRFITFYLLFVYATNKSFLNWGGFSFFNPPFIYHSSSYESCCVFHNNFFFCSFFCSLAYIVLQSHICNTSPCNVLYFYNISAYDIDSFNIIRQMDFIVLDLFVSINHSTILWSII